MSMVQGDLVATTDITSLVRSKVSDYLDTAKNGGTGKVPTGQSTGVSWSSSADVVKSENETELKKLGGLIEVTSMYDIIINCLWNACCVYWQKYSYYPYTSGGSQENTGKYPDKVEKIFRGVEAVKHVTNAQYRANYPPSSLPGFPKKYDLIVPFGLGTILDILVEYNRSLETTIDHGCRNVCYTSCHSNCHGSSRSRR